MTRRRSYPLPTRHYPRAPLPAAGRPCSEKLSAGIGAALLLLILVAVLVGPEVAAWPPNAVATEDSLKPPSAVHPLGTDILGRDVLSRLLHGGRLSLSAALSTVSLAVALGTLLGVIGGYRGGAVDTVIVAIADVTLAFPSLLLALVLAWLLGQGMGNAAIGVAVATMPVYIRLARANVRRLRRQPYVRAAQAIGAKESRILLRHILPNALGPLVAVAVLDVGWAMLHVSAISFLGVGAQPPQAEWGQMLSEARAHIRQAPWLGLAPGLAIALTVLSINLVAEALQNSFDPLRSLHL